MQAAPRVGPLSYALVTAARNEEQFIERTLQSVVMQTRLPIRWIIVSDGSTDGTDAIVRDYAQRYRWIDLLRVEGGEGRDFARKVRAFSAGYEKLRDVPYDIVGNLDADLSFDEEFFASLLEKFVGMPDLGVAGAPYLEGGVHYDYRFSDINDVAGSCQLFRRACFEDVGGYVPVEDGGIDWIAVATARMKGWKTRTFLDRPCVHHRKMGSAGRRTWEVWFRRGAQDYARGGDPRWEVARSLYQSTHRPYAIGGLLLLSGYAYQALRRSQRPVSRELLQFHRAEQMRRLKQAASGLLARRTRRENGPNTTADVLDESLRRLERWVETHEYRGYEPFDGLSSCLRPLTLDNRFLQQLLMQLVRQSPINLRPLLGIKPLESTKGRGYMAWGYLALFRRTCKDAYRRKAIACLDWLIRNKSPLYPDYSWGNHFDFASRAGTYAKQESIIVWTALVGQAFLDGYELLQDARYLEVAEGICNWILKLPREQSATGICLSYLASRQLSIHNANLLGAAMLARTAKHTGNEQLLDVARAAVEYTCARQHPDGAWYYAEESRYHWIDNFHTGYILDSLKGYIESSGDRTFQPHLDLGWRYFKTTFIGRSGEPRYYHDRMYPIDIQCAAQAIETLANFAEDDADALPTALKVAHWTIGNMQDPRGYFYYRRYPFFVTRIPMLHWGQATMYRALAVLSLKLAHEDGSVGAQRADGH